MSHNTVWIIIKKKASNKPQNTVSCTTNCNTAQKLVSQRFGLCNSAERTHLQFGCIEINFVLCQVESFLQLFCELTNTTTLLTENFFGAGGINDNFIAGWCTANFYARIAIFSEFALEKLVQFSFEYAIIDYLEKVNNL